MTLLMTEIVFCFQQETVSDSSKREFHFNWRDNSEKESHWHEEKCGSLSLLQLLLPCSLHFDELWHCNGGFFDFCWLLPTFYGTHNTFPVSVCYSIPTKDPLSKGNLLMFIMFIYGFFVLIYMPQNVNSNVAGVVQPFELSWPEWWSDYYGNFIDAQGDSTSIQSSSRATKWIYEVPIKPSFEITFSQNGTTSKKLSNLLEDVDKSVKIVNSASSLSN